MKVIQVTIDERLLTALDRALGGSRRQRSAFIRRSIANELRRIRRQRLEEADRRGYAKLPIEPDELSVEPEALTWGDEWRPRKRRAKASFSGLLKGATITEADICKAKRSLFRHARLK